MNTAEMMQFATGAVRGRDAEAERWDLIPVLGLVRLARTCAEGAKRYGVGNWLRGIPVSDLVNHAIRHLYLYLAGDKTEDHLAHAAWNILAACHMEMAQPDMKDIVGQWPDPQTILAQLNQKAADSLPENPGR